MLDDSFHTHTPEPSSMKRFAPHAAIIGAAVIAVGLIGYALHEHNNAVDLANQNQQVTAQLQSTSSQLLNTNNALNALNAKVDALEKPSPAAPTAETEARRHAAAHRAYVANQRLNQRFDKLQTQIDAQNKAITDTQTDLATTRTNLTGSIAHTHDELVVLEKRGQRNYYEFDIDKSKQFNHEGPVEISLRKANVKRQYADLNLIVDDRTVQQKHVNLYQPSMFYLPDSPQPVQIVINGITKNHIHGYISAPKYRESELTAMSNSVQQQNQGGDSGPVQVANSNQQQPQRQKLPVPASEPY
jgi:hypothetical protein